MKNDRGFTLIELLIVLGIVFLLSFLAYVSLTNMMEKGRDAKRISDINAIQAAIEFAKKSDGTYADVCGALDEIGRPLYTCVKDGDRIKAFLPGIGQLRDPGVPAMHCGITCAAVCDYALVEAGTDSYKIKFYLENGFNDQPSGCYVATTSGIEKIDK